MKITELPMLKWEYSYTCPRCGNHTPLKINLSETCWDSKDDIAEICSNCLR